MELTPKISNFPRSVSGSRLGWIGVVTLLLLGFPHLVPAVGKEPISKTSNNQLAVARNSDDRLELFQVDIDGEVRHRWQKERNGEWSPWSTLGGSFLPGIAASLDANGNLEVFGVDQAHRLHCIQQKGRPGHDWSAWQELGGSSFSPVVVGKEADGRLEVFAVDGQSRTVKHIWQANSSGSWSDWRDLGAGPSAGLVVVTNEDDRLELFGVDDQNHLVHCWESTINDPTHWSDWVNMGGSILPGLAADQNADGQIEVFAGWRKRQSDFPHHANCRWK